MPEVCPFADTPCFNYLKYFLGKEADHWVEVLESLRHLKRFGKPSVSVRVPNIHVRTGHPWMNLSFIDELGLHLNENRSLISCKEFIVGPIVLQILLGITSMVRRCTTLGVK